MAKGGNPLFAGATLSQPSHCCRANRSPPKAGVETLFYNTNVNAGANVAAAPEIQIGALSPSPRVNLSATLHNGTYLEFINPT